MNRPTYGLSPGSRPREIHSAVVYFPRTAGSPVGIARGSRTTEGPQ